MRVMLSAAPAERLGPTTLLTADSENLSTVVTFTKKSDLDEFLERHPIGTRFIATGKPMIRSEKVTGSDGKSFLMDNGKPVSHLDLRLQAAGCSFVSCGWLQKDVCFVSGLMRVERSASVESQQGEPVWRGVLAHGEFNIPGLAPNFYSAKAFGQAARKMEEFAIEGTRIYVANAKFTSDTQEVATLDGIISRRYVKIIINSVESLLDVGG